MFDFAWKPDWLWLALSGLFLAALLGLSYRWARGTASWRWRMVFILLRLVIIAVIVLCWLDPQRIKEIKHYPPSWVAVLLDTSRSMACKEGDQTRLEQARQWVHNDLKLPVGFSPVMYGFSSNLVSLPNLDAAVANGGQTAYAQTLNDLMSETALNPPASVILLSDGSDNSLKNFEPAARAFGEKQIPINTVLLGSTNEPPDIVVENVQVKRTLPNQTQARAVVSLRGPGFEHHKVPLFIKADGRILARHEVEISGTSQQVELEFAPGAPGFHMFTAEIPSQTGERRLDNNRRDFGLTVTDHSLRVIYMEASGDGKTGFQPLYLKHALEDIPGIQIKTLYCDQASASPATDNRVAHVDPKDGQPIYYVQNSTQGYPHTLEGLLKYDVVICSDIPREDFTPEQLKNTEKFVTQYGGGFVMVGGHTSFGSGNYQHTIIDKLIPVAMEQQTSYRTTTFVPRLAPNALNHPIMQLSANARLNREIWTTKFPRLLGYNRVDRAKPGAVVLLEHPTSRTAYGPDIILAVQEVGQGRTMAFTSDTTADWGEYFESIWGEKIHDYLPLSPANCDSRYYKQFWLNSVRWLAAHKYNLENSFVNLELKNTYFDAQDKIPVHVHVMDREGKEIRNAKVTLNLAGIQADMPAVKAVFDDQSQAFLASVKLPKAGVFLIKAKAVLPNGRTGEDQQVVVGEAADSELADIRARPANLSAIARWSGGKSLASKNDAQGSIAPVIGNVKPAAIEYQHTSLWDKPWLLSVIISLLTIEWGLRRWRGMA